MPGKIRISEYVIIEYFSKLLEKILPTSLKNFGDFAPTKLFIAALSSQD